LDIGIITGIIVSLAIVIFVIQHSLTIRAQNGTLEAHNAALAAHNAILATHQEALNAAEDMNSNIFYRLSVLEGEVTDLQSVTSALEDYNDDSNWHEVELND
jgi:hypothetical protein